MAQVYLNKMRRFVLDVTTTIACFAGDEHYSLTLRMFDFAVFWYDFPRL